MLEHPGTRGLIRTLRQKANEDDLNYVSRVQTTLPHLPAELAVDWFKRHGTGVLQNSCFLDHRRLRFCRTKWPTDRFADVTVRCEIADWSESFVARDSFHFHSGGLAEYMLAAGTWPVPPSILVGPGRLVGPLQVGPLHLLEGHKRLAYLLGMAHEGLSSLHREHVVWEAREDPS